MFHYEEQSPNPFSRFPFPWFRVVRKDDQKVIVDFLRDVNVAGRIADSLNRSHWSVGRV